VGVSKGVLFTFDALLGSMILLAALVFLLHGIPEAAPAEQASFYAQDALAALSVLQINQVEHPWVVSQIANGTIEDPTMPVIEQIGTFWATNQSEAARNLTEIVIEDILPSSFGVTVTLGDEELFRKNISSWSQRSVARRMITGIEKGEALEGSTSTAYLKRIKDKQSYAITYFGGFTGQGNITLALGPLPSDLTNNSIVGITVQLDTVDDFSLSFNGVSCTTLTSDGLLMGVQVWDVTECNASLETGMNNVTFRGLGDIADAYVAGGYVKVDYLTDVFQEESGNGTTKRYTFPVIDGVINLYDSVYAPGVVTDWYLNLTFWSNYTTYMRLGNQTIFTYPGSDSTQNVVFEAHNLTWSPTTVPLRLGTTNFTNVTMITDGQPADTALVTDVSGSMDTCAEQYTGDICSYICFRNIFNWYTMACPFTTGSCTNEYCGACNPSYSDLWYSTYWGTLCDRTRLEIAQDAAKAAVEIILNSTGNEITLVGYDEQVRNFLALTGDVNALNTEINSYYADDGTCICCGINRAKNEIKDSTDKKFMIVMSDGDANYECSDFDDYVGSYDETDGPQSTIDAGQNACNNHNITVFTVGFGAGMSSQGRTTLQNTACNTSLYYDAINESDLEEIYRNISEQIRLSANFTAQTLQINGSYIASHIMEGSYLDLVFNTTEEEPAQNEILVKFETPEFANCTTELVVPTGLRLTEAVVTSYSGPYWTSYVEVNGKPVFNLSEYNTDFELVGDPFLVTLPLDVLNFSRNNVSMIIMDNDQNTTNCSDNNTIFYQGVINSSVPRSTVLESAVGCDWSIEFEDGHFLNVTIPTSYVGSKQCNYTNASLYYDPLDSYDVGVYRLLDQLDFDDDRRVFVNIEAADLEIIVTVVTSVPYLWGPTFALLEVWR
jgi:hypothetical protein